MTARTPRISRRKLLQISSVAPLSALLATGTATDAEVAVIATKLPKDIEDDLWDKAKGVTDANEKTFRKAVKLLVEYFWHGADDNGLLLPPGKVKFLYVDVAYEQKNAPLGSRSGDLIAARSKSWENQLYETTACAYNCGAEFAIAGPDFSSEQSVREKYAIAYNTVKDSMTALLERARRAHREIPDDAPGGAGC